MSPLALAQSAVAVVSQGAPPAPEAMAKARADLAAALAGEGGDDLQILFHAFQFHFRSGNLEEAERLCRRRLELAPPDSPHAARAWCNLGILKHTLGELEDAERSLTRAVEIDRANGNIEGLARNLGNLGLIPETRGDIDRAELLFCEALSLAEPLQTPPGDQIVASMLANLGDLALRRDDKMTARDHWNRSVAIYQRLGFTKWLPDLQKKLADLDRR